MTGKPPAAPYPPELEEEEPRELELGDLVDAVLEDVDWANQRPARGIRLRRVELRRCQARSGRPALRQSSSASFSAIAA